MDKYTDAEIKRMARQWMKGDSFYGWDHIGDAPRTDRINAVRCVLRGDGGVYTPEFIAAVLAERAKIDAERAPAPSVEDAADEVYRAIYPEPHAQTGAAGHRLWHFARAVAAYPEALRAGLAAVKAVTRG